MSEQLGGAWRLLVDDGATAARGLALDEALMAAQHRDQPPAPATLRLYTYRDHAALIGRYQHLDAEVDLQACRASGTQVSRRPTGGGAIIMGAAQLGVALTMRAPARQRPRQLIAELSAGVAAGLAELGITASFRGKNDLQVGGRKIAGLGLYVDDSGGLLFHASVLADLDVAFMLQVLAVPAAKLADKAAAAVAERVTTVSRETGQGHTGASIREAIATGFAKQFSLTLEPGEPSAAERALAERLVGERYAHTEWVRASGRVPDGSGSALLKTPAGLVRLYLATHGDLVKSAVFTGDFNDLPDPVLALESALRWDRLSVDAVTRSVRATAAAGALEVGEDALIEAVLRAGRQATTAAAALPVRATGSCYFPDQG